MCIDCVKESKNKSEKLQISDLSLIIQDKITENIEILERYQTIYSKESSINDLLRKVFKSMHEILYEIEHNKRLELDYIGVGLLKYSSFADANSGQSSNQIYQADGTKIKSDSDQIETKEIFTKLQEMQKQIGKYVKEQNYLE